MTPCGPVWRGAKGFAGERLRHRGWERATVAQTFMGWTSTGGFGGEMP